MTSDATFHLDPGLRTELESILDPGESAAAFIDASLHRAIESRRRALAVFQERAHAASEEYHRTGIAIPAHVVLDEMRAMVDAKRKALGR